MRKIIAANWKMNKTRPWPPNFAGQLAMAPQNARGPSGPLCFSALLPTLRQLRMPLPASTTWPLADRILSGRARLYRRNFLRHAARCRRQLAAGRPFPNAAGMSLAETDGLIAQKTAFGLERGFKVMLCVGETARNATTTSSLEFCSASFSSAIQPLANGILSKSP